MDIARNAAAVAILLLVLGGCRTWSQPGEYTWKVVAPAKVMRVPGSDLIFHVETTDNRGQAVEGIAYIWIVEWVGLHGYDHRGSSYSDESIRVKGRHGTAYIRIFTYDDRGLLAEVAKQPFEVD